MFKIKREIIDVFYVIVLIHNIVTMNKYVNLLNTLMSSNLDNLRESNRQYIKENYTWAIICNKFQTEINNILTKYKEFNGNEYLSILKQSNEFINNQKWVEYINTINKIKHFPVLDHYYTSQLHMGLALYNLKQYDLSKTYFKKCRKIKNDFEINKFLALIGLEKQNLNKFVKYGLYALENKFDMTQFLLALLFATFYIIYHLAVTRLCGLMK
jgi:tetratricopeptide (TPR) repeat protein